VRLYCSEKVVLRKLRIVRAGGPTDEDCGFPIWISFRLPEAFLSVAPIWGSPVLKSSSSSFCIFLVYWLFD
jgi:hypothetical protein